jgi:hypothetical protein
MYTLTIIIHYILGFGVLNTIKFQGSRWEKFGLSFPLGLGAATLILFFMDILQIRLTFLSTLIATVIIAALLLIRYFFSDIPIKAFIISHKFKKIALHERIFIVIIAVCWIISSWRSFYLPVTTYDSIQGIDLLAKYAVTDGRISSHMFSDLKDQLSTQPYYAPFVAFSQILYRLAGHPFGTVWLAFIFLSFIILFYYHIRRVSHPICAGMLTILLISIPEFYPYTFLLQTDFTNAVFVVLAVIYAYQYLKNQKMNSFLLSSILFGFGVWSRSETIGFMLLTIILLVIFSHSGTNSFKLFSIYCGVGFFFFAIWNLIYLPLVLNYHGESFFEFGFWNSQRLWILLDGTLHILINLELWGYVLPLFVIVLLLNTLVFHDYQHLFIILWLVAMYIGFIVLLYHLQLSLEANINNTFRRGIFKLLPIMIYYIGVSKPIKKISNYLYKYQFGY